MAGLTKKAYNAYVVRGGGGGLEAKCFCIRSEFLPIGKKHLYMQNVH